ncbi:MAG TPA: 50S ribosomal protein L18 [bacterium]|nr:50S ribosomal protein L18 [Myxococcales bacterium]OQA58618.1 MAG: 50S ribosomal protein L18 [bacterium ADurb.Bin270]HPW45364.1 50S ribosomal protein L18 [bacterium]HQG13161.1 50S ribosomal protein L18 [bacterium]HQH80754.1 50S ribosomal protein L18 [bacterium]
MAMELVGRDRRRNRIRKKIHGTAEKPRLSVFRSAKHISAQLIDDDSGTTLVSASTYQKNAPKGTGNCTSAKGIGEMIAERAKQKGIEAVVFDRGGYRYHGRVKALAEGARQKGLKF